MKCSLKKILALMIVLVISMPSVVFAEEKNITVTSAGTEVGPSVTIENDEGTGSAIQEQAQGSSVPVGQEQAQEGSESAGQDQTGNESEPSGQDAAEEKTGSGGQEDSHEEIQDDGSDSQAEESSEDGKESQAEESSEDGKESQPVDGSEDGTEQPDKEDKVEAVPSEGNESAEPMKSIVKLEKSEAESPESGASEQAGAKDDVKEAVRAGANTDSVAYIDHQGRTAYVDPGDYKEISSEDYSWSQSAKTWYVVKGNITLTNLVTVSGRVNLILCDGAVLTVNKGIKVEGNDGLSIFAQSTGDDMGKLVTKGEEEFQAGIGGSDDKNGGTVAIIGGNIDVTGGKNGAGIGGGWNGDGGEIIISGGVVNAKGGQLAAGIGGGRYGDGGNITISGGTIKLAQGGDGDGTDSGSGAGIGGGHGGHATYKGGNGGKIIINGGTIEKAMGGKSGAGIGGGDYGDGGDITIRLNAHIISAEGGRNGAGIGGGYEGEGGTISIEGGLIEEAKGGAFAAGIGGGRHGDGGNIIISGGRIITAEGGEDPDHSTLKDKIDGAGIGGGGKGDSGDIEINGDARIENARSKECAAGIGGGAHGDADNITIGGNATILSAQSNMNGAGIGSGGYSDKVNKITISGGVVNAVSGNGGGAAIGGGSYSLGGKINISGGEVNATSGIHGAGIGSGCGEPDEYDSTVEIRISGGKVTAVGYNGAGIGGGMYRCGEVYISGGEINASNIGLGNGAGIGGGRIRKGGIIEISGGTVVATGNNTAAGIGGGGAGSISTTEREEGGYGGNIKISGADTKVTAQGGYEAAGIGGGRSARGGTIEISGGTVEAKGGSEGAGIGGGGSYMKKTDGYGGNIKISGADTKVTARGGNFAAGIGGGAMGDGGTINISDGAFVEATGGIQAAGIGGGAGDNITMGGRIGDITISGEKTVVNASTRDLGAGIGCGCHGRGGTITIKGGTVTAVGGLLGAGIGGGANLHYFSESDICTGGTIKISGGKINAVSLGGGAGIGGGGGEKDGTEGLGTAAGTIEISGGEIEATGTGGSAGIGGGSGGAGGNIKISGGTIIAKGIRSYYEYIHFDKTTRSFYEGGAGIGGGCFADGGTIEITGGSVTAITEKGEDGLPDNCAAIGGGEGASSGKITISGGTIVANGQKAGIGCGVNGTGGDGLALTYSDKTRTGMSVHASGYNCSVNIKSGKYFTDGFGNQYEGELGTDKKEAIADKTIFPGLSAFYLDTEGNKKGPVPCNPVDQNTKKLEMQKETDGWYLVNSNTNISGSSFSVSGDVNLILGDEANLTVPVTISMQDGSSLTVWSQSNGEKTGRLTAQITGTKMGIQGNDCVLTVNGGTIYVVSETKQGIWLQGGSMTVNGGSVTAEGSTGIFSENLTVNGGKCSAVGRSQAAVELNSSANDVSLNVSAGSLSAGGSDYGIKAASIYGKVKAVFSGGTTEISGGNAAMSLSSDGSAEVVSGMAVYSSKEAGAVPVHSLERERTLKTKYAKIIPCGTVDCPHEVNRTTGNCRYCEEPLDCFKLTLVPYSDTAGKLVALIGNDRVYSFGTPYVEKNEKVKLCAEISPGHELKALTAKTASGTIVELDNENSFYMPGDEVTATAEFDTLHSINKTVIPNDLSGGNVTVKVNGSEADKAEKDSTVTLEVVSGAGYAPFIISVRTKSGEEISVTNNSFSMPDDDVDITAFFVSEWETLQLAVLTAGENTVDVSQIAGDDKKITALDSQNALRVPNNLNVTLDLKGCVIDRGLSKKDKKEKGNVIDVVGTLTLKDTEGGGVITGGNNKDNGGGVIIYGTLNMEGGNITGNSAGAAGGVYISENAVFNMSGGNIGGNEAADPDFPAGGGVYVYENSDFRVSGLAQITGNTVKKDGKAVADNVFLCTGAVINVTDELDKEALFGVNTMKLPDKGAPVVITSGLKDKGSLSNFNSDNDEYSMFETGTGEAAIGIPLDVTFNITPPGHGSVTADRDPAKYFEDETVTLTIAPESGRRLKEISAEDSDKTPVALSGTGNTRTFKMAGKNVAVTAVFEDIPAVKPTITGVASLTGNDALTYGYAEDSSISVSATAPEGHKISAYQWYSCDSTGGNMEKIDGADAAEYVIPEGLGSGDYFYCCTVTAKRDDNGQTASETSGPAEVTVKQKSLTVKADAKTKYKGEADPELTYTVTGLVGKDKLSGSLARDPGEDVGSYAIRQGTLKASDNYKIKYTGAKLTIKAALRPDYTILPKLNKSGNSGLWLSWSKVKDAQGYDIYFTRCTSVPSYRQLDSVNASVNRYKITGLRKGTCYKAMVRAWKKVNGKKTYIGKISPSVHSIVGGYNSNNANAKSVSLNRTSLTLKKGGSTTVKASVTSVKEGLKALSHHGIRWYSSNAAVAMVSKSGKVTAVEKGTCTIYALTDNGMRASVKVTVK